MNDEMLAGLKQMMGGGPGANVASPGGSMMGGPDAMTSRPPGAFRPPPTPPRSMIPPIGAGAAQEEEDEETKAARVIQRLEAAGADPRKIAQDPELLLMLIAPFLRVADVARNQLGVSEEEFSPLIPKLLLIVNGDPQYTANGAGMNPQNWNDAYQRLRAAPAGAQRTAPIAGVTPGELPNVSTTMAIPEAYSRSVEDVAMVTGADADALKERYRISRGREARQRTDERRDVPDRLRNEFAAAMDMDAEALKARAARRRR